MTTAPPGYLAYGPLLLGREHTCSGCEVRFVSKSGRGKKHWCPRCQDGPKHREHKRECDRKRRKRNKR